MTIAAYPLALTASSGMYASSIGAVRSVADSQAEPSALLLARTTVWLKDSCVQTAMVSPLFPAPTFSDT